jgi:ABC-type multidrug transport system ATPase subunit
MPPIIEIKNLHKSFKKFQALKGVSMTVNEGEIFGFLGCNGAGKSTTIRCMLTLIKPDSGEIFFKGKNIKTCRSEFLQAIGCIVEKPDFYKNMSVVTNLRLSAMLYGKNPTKKELYDCLELVGLKDKELVKFKACSQGMKQRLGIAAALIHNPEIIILDEPSNGLDPRGMIELRNLILKMKNELKKTIIISSHILSEVELIVDSMIIIDKGVNVIQGSAEELLHGSEVMVNIETIEPQKLMEKIKKSTYASHLESQVENQIIIKSTMKEIPQLHKDIVLMDEPISAFYSRKKLEDLFLKLTDTA